MFDSSILMIRINKKYICEIDELLRTDYNLYILHKILGVALIIQKTY